MWTNDHDDSLLADEHQNWMPIKVTMSVLLSPILSSSWQHCCHYHQHCNDNLQYKKKCQCSPKIQQSWYWWLHAKEMLLHWLPRQNYKSYNGTQHYPSNGTNLSSHQPTQNHPITGLTGMIFWRKIPCYNKASMYICPLEAAPVPINESVMRGRESQMGQFPTALGLVTMQKIYP